MTGAGETFTERELEEHFQRVQSSRNVMGGAGIEAARIVRDIKAHREPEYEPGEMYRDAAGETWKFGQLRMPQEPCWFKPGADRAYAFKVPVRPLRKLVLEPEGYLDDDD